MFPSKSSKWLQRLRSSRGFPDSDHIDLEHFLSTPHNNIISTYDPSYKTPLPQEKTVTEKCYDDTRPDSINNILSDLFCMGEFENKSNINRKKSRRKQQCPKTCVVEDVRTERFCLPSRLRLTSRSRDKVKGVSYLLGNCVGEEEEKGNRDFSGYSQTEVTVIDTSVPCWKFEKVLYRSKNVWKFEDKKGIGDRNKRKEIEDGGDVKNKNKKKKLKKKLTLCNSSKYVVDKEEEYVVPSNFKQGHDKGKMIVAINEKKRDDCGQVQEKSFCKKQIDEDSSVILIRSIPTSKKNVSSVSNISVKSMQR